MRLADLFRDNPHRYPLGYYAGLDGLRGIMAIAVMAAHVREAWCPGAFAYMNTFFLMSAYLITALLLKGWKREGRIGFGTFYYRRALRLFPANYAMIGVFLIAAYFLLDDFAGHARQALVAGLYISNWTRAFDVPMPQFLGHTWSLAIEEQYYLLWPLLLAAVLKTMGLRWRSVVTVALVALAFAAWRSWLTFDGATISRLYNGTDTRADALLAGCALAMALALPGVRENPGLQRAARLLAPVAILAWVVAGYTLQWEMRSMYAGISLLMTVVSAVLVMALVLPTRTMAHRLFEFPPLVFLGRICYGLYLWHFPVYNVMRFGLGAPDTVVALVGMPLTLVLAMLSWRFVERPFLVMKDRMPESRATA